MVRSDNDSTLKVRHIIPDRVEAHDKTIIIYHAGNHYELLNTTDVNRLANLQQWAPPAVLDEEEDALFTACCCDDLWRDKMDAETAARHTSQAASTEWRQKCEQLQLERGQQLEQLKVELVQANQDKNKLLGRIRQLERQLEEVTKLNERITTLEADNRRLSRAQSSRSSSSSAASSSQLAEELQQSKQELKELRKKLASVEEQLRAATTPSNGMTFLTTHLARQEQLAASPSASLVEKIRDLQERLALAEATRDDALKKLQTTGSPASTSSESPLCLPSSPSTTMDAAKRKRRKKRKDDSSPTSAVSCDVHLDHSGGCSSPSSTATNSSSSVSAESPLSIASSSVLGSVARELFSSDSPSSSSGGVETGEPRTHGATEQGAEGEEETPASELCEVCHKSTSGKWLDCDNCHRWFHLSCVGLGASPSKRRGWICRGCDERERVRRVEVAGCTRILRRIENFIKSLPNGPHLFCKPINDSAYPIRPICLTDIQAALTTPTYSRERFEQDVESLWRSAQIHHPCYDDEQWASRLSFVSWIPEKEESYDDWVKSEMTNWRDEISTSIAARRDLWS